IAAIGVLAFGSIVVFVADHFVRPVLIGGSIRLPFVWVLLGVLGGVESFGLLGLFLGPALLAVLITRGREVPRADAALNAPALRHRCCAATSTAAFPRWERGRREPDRTDHAEGEKCSRHRFDLRYRPRHRPRSCPGWRQRHDQRLRRGGRD